MLVFSSGTANLLQSISSGYYRITPLHSLYFNYIGVNFLGLFNNIKQHIQFIKFIKGDLILPNDILLQFFAVYNIGIDNFSIFDSLDIIPNKINNIKNNFNNCDWFIFEIETLDYYISTIDNIDYQVSKDFSNNSTKLTQTEEDFINDLSILISLLPPNKQILFQTSYTRNDIIYNSINNANLKIYEPTFIINKNNYYDNFLLIYTNYLLKNQINNSLNTIDTNNTNTDNTNNTNNTNNTDNTNNTTDNINNTDNTNNTTTTTTTDNTDNTNNTNNTDNTNTDNTNTDNTDNTDNTNNTTTTTDNINNTDNTDNTDNINNTDNTDNTNNTTTTTDNINNTDNTTTTNNTNNTTTDNTDNTDNTNNTDNTDNTDNINL